LIRSRRGVSHFRLATTEQATLCSPESTKQVNFDRLRIKASHYRQLIACSHRDNTLRRNDTHNGGHNCDPSAVQRTRIHHTSHTRERAGRGQQHPGQGEAQDSGSGPAKGWSECRNRGREGRRDPTHHVSHFSSNSAAVASPYGSESLPSREPENAASGHWRIAEPPEHASLHLAGPPLPGILCHLRAQCAGA
jgi:hypothetical protein